MKKNIVSLAFMAVFLLMATNSQAQSWKDLLNKDNISKVVNAITGTPETIDMTGTWNYKKLKYINSILSPVMRRWYSCNRSPTHQR